MTALDMATCIVDELTMLENSGLDVYDAFHNEHILVIANPMASQLLNHLGGSAIKYCRICMVCICVRYVVCFNRYMFI